MKRFLNAASSSWDVLKRSLRTLTLTDLAICIVGLAFAVVIRYLLLDFKSSDFLNSLKPWYVTIRDMGFAAFGTDFTTYNPPYLYEMYLIARFFPDTSNLLATKIPSLIGDFIGAIFVYAPCPAQIHHRPLCAVGGICLSHGTHRGPEQRLLGPG